MEGFYLSYRTIDAKSNTLLNHSLYGRLVYRNYKGKRYASYVSGMLHNIPFSRIKNSTVFLKTLDGIDLEMLKIFGDATIERGFLEKCEFETAEEHWKKIVNEKGLVMKYGRNKKR